MRKHKQSVHADAVVKCPQPGCEYSSASKTHVAVHLKGLHGTAGSFACDHPGCTFRSTWRASIGQHKRKVHSNERPFACDHNGCGFRSKTRSDLSDHKNTVHLKIRDKRCHVCEKGFYFKSCLRSHMNTHEGDGHEARKCEDCSVNLRSRWSHGRKSSRQAAGQFFICDHQGCDYKSRWKSTILSHQKQVHSEERPFLCSHAGCSLRSKTKIGLRAHQNRVHLKIRTKCCHVCDKRFFSVTDLRAHITLQHLTKDHNVDKCEDCVRLLKKNHKRSQALKASHKRRAETGGTSSNPVKRLNIEYHERREMNSIACKEMQVESQTRCLNDDLVDMHMDMQLLSSL